MKKQLLALAGAAALGVGAIAGNTVPSHGVEPTAQLGYFVAKRLNAGPGGQAFAQATGGAAGGVAGAAIGALVGAKYGAKVGAIAGPVGLVVGAGVGAL